MRKVVMCSAMCLYVVLLVAFCSGRVTAEGTNVAGTYLVTNTIISSTNDFCGTVGIDQVKEIVTQDGANVKFADFRSADEEDSPDNSLAPSDVAVMGADGSFSGTITLIFDIPDDSSCKVSGSGSFSGKFDLSASPISFKTTSSVSITASGDCSEFAKIVSKEPTSCTLSAKSSAIRL
jgi:hypothetical protein